MDKARVIRIAGALVKARGLSHASIYDVVYVGSAKLLGEIIKIEGEDVSIQVYEDTTGLRVGDEITSTDAPLSIELGPGLLSGIFDGILRPLAKLEKISGSFISSGLNVPALDRTKKWHFVPQLKKGDSVKAGQILGHVMEEGIQHFILVPPFVQEDRILDIKEGGVNVIEVVATLAGGKELMLKHNWPVRVPRPVRKKLKSTVPLITGTRIIDTLFPIAKGGTAIIPGGFGTGKTVLEQTIAKYADSDIIIYIGCGERGNEMTSVLREFPELLDPYRHTPLMARTVLIANTSNMPVAAREASIYVGVTIAEYFRDMGYHVALMADSTSRWAEALREISSRLEEMPGEEGYPAYLGARISSFYERSGIAIPLADIGKEGSVSIIGAVSPPGGDFSEPVTQASLRMAGAFWALDTNLAYRRHFPAINWSISYSLYRDELKPWFSQNVAQDFDDLCKSAGALLQKEIDIQKVAQVVGIESLPEEERLILESCGMIREIFLQQNAMHSQDAFSSLKRQEKLLKAVLEFHKAQFRWLKSGKTLEEILEHPIKNRFLKLRELTEEEFFKEIDPLITEINA